ncbi:MAG: DUF177 domain-containing protein [Parasphingorhabdus sp.]|uniref:YceD family protein n=1 Tax=Parasphingorhabdus sp. TaxID=2709688 RepID=UPI003298468A
MTSVPALPTPELSVLIKLSDLGATPATDSIVATDEQCLKLAERFGLPSIQSLTASYRLEARTDDILFTGSIDAQLEQTCAISGEAFPVHVLEDFHIIFVEKQEYSGGEEEIELESDDCDMIEYEQAQIDIGEAVAQTLLLALDPYPRGPNAEKVADKKGLKSEEEAGPFGALAALKDKLS